MPSKSNDFIATDSSDRDGVPNTSFIVWQENEKTINKAIKAAENMRDFFMLLFYSLFQAKTTLS